MANNNTVRVFSMFSGIGGFEYGLQQSNIKYKMVGYSEVDKYAIEIFEKHFEGVKNYGNATTIDETKLPNFDLLVGGFPCQAFSVAGKLRGFDDTRGTLFFDIARILLHKKPKHFILENVRGLLSHGSGRTFQTIIRVLTNLGYLVEWEVLNSKNYGVPQNRERVYIIGHLRGSSRPKVFPIEGFSEESNSKDKSNLEQIGNIDTKGHNSIWGRIYDTNGISSTINAHGGGLGAKTGLYQVGVIKNRGKIKSRDKSTCLDANYYKGLDNHGGRTGVKVKQSLASIEFQIRRLTPLECERLQGFPDNWTKGLSDTQRYKCIGNAVTTTVIRKVVNRLYPNI